MKVFISYRREDTAAAAGRVYDRLCLVLKKPNVFFDVSAIRGGEDYERSIESAIGGSDAALVFIGDKWLARTPPAEVIRLWQPGDYVRAEVRGALARPMLVLPVLVGGAPMPQGDKLPEDIRAITTRNALLLRHESFDDDTENIVAAILGTSAKSRSWDSKSSLWFKVACAGGAMMAAWALLVVAALVHFWLLARPLSASIGAPITAIVLIAGSLVGGWVGLRYAAQKRPSR